MDALVEAIIDAGTELGTEHGWCFEDESGAPTKDDYFTKIMLKHLRPLLGDGYKKARIAALKAELASLLK